jgi:hypothetical protein
MPVNNQYKKNLGLIFLILLFQFHERFRAQIMADHPIVLTSLIKPKFDFNEKEFRDEFRKKYDGKFLFSTSVIMFFQIWIASAVILKMF